MQPNETYGWRDNNPATGAWEVVDSYDVEMQRQALLLKLKSTAYNGYSSTYEYVALSTLQPLACAPGTFCFGGVAHPTTIDWIPSKPKVRQHPKLVLKVHIVRKERRLQQGLVLAFLAITVRQVQVILHKLLLVTSLIAKEVWFLRYVSLGHGRH